MNCPLCQEEMIEAKFAACKYWECKKEIYIDNKHFVHYRNVVYNNGELYCKYIYPPFLVESINNVAQLTLLRSSEKTSLDSYYKTDTVITKHESFILDADTQQNILSRLRIYNIFS